jgi:hypothetical protein
MTPEAAEIAYQMPKAFSFRGIACQTSVLVETALALPTTPVKKRRKINPARSVTREYEKRTRAINKVDNRKIFLAPSLFIKKPQVGSKTIRAMPRLVDTIPRSAIAKPKLLM